MCVTTAGERQPLFYLTAVVCLTGFAGIIFYYEIMAKTDTGRNGNAGLVGNFDGAGSGRPIVKSARFEPH